MTLQQIILAAAWNAIQLLAAFIILILFKEIYAGT